MHAITVDEYGAAATLTDVPDPRAGQGHVLIKIEAAGMNPMDRMIANGGWKARMPATFPLILGADLAGGVGSFATQLAANAGAHVIAVARIDAADRMRAYGAAETVDRTAVSVPDAVRRTCPDGIDVLVDVASDANGFSDLASLVRPGGTALTTRYVADTEALASREVTGVNFLVSMSSGVLGRLADAVVSGRIVVPPITRVRLDDVPALDGNAHADGKTVITF